MIMIIRVIVVMVMVIVMLIVIGFIHNSNLSKNNSQDANIT